VTAAPSGWRWDAAPDDPLTALRIPVTREVPEYPYLVAFDRTSPVRPTDAEAAMLRSYLDYYVERWYNATWQARLKERPFDIDGGANGIVFVKYAEGSWGYRRRSWRHSYQPAAPWDPATGYKTRRPAEEILALPALLDRVASTSDSAATRWTRWKANNPEVFGGAQ
jgi:hypothetical protein